MIKTKLRIRILCSFVFFTLIITIIFTSIGMLLLQDAEDIITNQQLEILVGNADIESLDGVTIYSKKFKLRETYELDKVPEKPGTYEFFADEKGKQGLIPDGLFSRWDMWVMNPRDREYRIIIPPFDNHSTTKQWIVVDLTDSEYTEANMDSLSILFSILLITLFIIAILGSLLVARWVMKPVITLSNSIKESNENAPLKLPSFSDDELGYLARTISQYDEEKFTQIKREQAFISDCSHELRTPITIINNSVAMLCELSMDDQRKEKVMARITRSGKRMQRLAQTFLLIGRNKQNDKETLNLHQIATEVIEEMKILNPEHSLNVINDIPKDLTILTRKESISILFHNLVGNCFQHLQSGNLNITIENQINNKSKKSITLLFADDGPGFHEPIIEKQLEDNHQSNKNGYGIGLMLIERLCQREYWILKREKNLPIGAKISVTI